MAVHVLMAMTNPLDGKAEDYNAWLDDVHIPEVLEVPGFISAERFEIATEQRVPGPHPYRYATLYRIETDDLAATIAALTEAVQKGRKTDTSDYSQRAIWFYSALGPVRAA